MFELLFLRTPKPVTTKLEEAPLTVGGSLAPQVIFLRIAAKLYPSLHDLDFCRIVALSVPTVALDTRCK